MLLLINYLVDDTNDNNDKDNYFAFGPNSHELIVVDPLNKQNNVAKSTFQFIIIKIGFLIAFMVVKEDRERNVIIGIFKIINSVWKIVFRKEF